MSLTGRTLLVTGAGRGIGRGAAIAIAEAGGRVVATDLERPLDTAEIVRDSGGDCLALSADVTRPPAIEEALDAAERELGPVDGLVTAAGVLAMDAAVELDVEDHRRQFSVNVDGVLHSCCAVARRMIADDRPGSIVNIASNAGKVGYPQMASYNASKAAVINLTRSLAGEWACHDINVNAVCPGGVDTPMLRQVADWLAPDLGIEPSDLLETMHPAQLGRHVQPIEIGRVVAFLLSDAALVVRGQAINADGGDTPY